MHSCVPICACVFHIYFPSFLLAPNRCKDLCVCMCLCQNRHTGAYTSTCRHLQVYMCPCSPHYSSRLRLSVYMPILPYNQHMHEFAVRSQSFPLPHPLPELPNAEPLRLAVVVTLIPRFLLQSACKWHYKFPNNWDEVLCKSPSRH